MSSAAESARRFLHSYQRRKRDARAGKKERIGQRPVNPHGPHEFKALTRDYNSTIQHSWACTCGKHSHRWWEDSGTALLSHQYHADRAARAAKFFEAKAAQPPRFTNRGRLVDEHW